jgi:hypothetical protein
MSQNSDAGPDWVWEASVNSDNDAGTLEVTEVDAALIASHFMWGRPHAVVLAEEVLRLRAENDQLRAELDAARAVVNKIVYVQAPSTEMLDELRAFPRTPWDDEPPTLRDGRGGWGPW